MYYIAVKMGERICVCEFDIQMTLQRSCVSNIDIQRVFNSTCHKFMSKCYKVYQLFDLFNTTYDTGKLLLTLRKEQQSSLLFVLIYLNSYALFMRRVIFALKIYFNLFYVVKITAI